MTSIFLKINSLKAIYPLSLIILITSQPNEGTSLFEVLWKKYITSSHSLYLPLSRLQDSIKHLKEMTL
jgi:hypothetical protein